MVVAGKAWALVWVQAGSAEGLHVKRAVDG